MATSSIGRATALDLDLPGHTDLPIRGWTTAAGSGDLLGRHTNRSLRHGWSPSNKCADLVACACLARIHRGTDRDTDARANAETERDPDPAPEQNANRCPDTGAEADTDARVLNFLSLVSLALSHRRLLPSSNTTVERLGTSG